MSKSEDAINRVVAELCLTCLQLSTEHSPIKFVIENGCIYITTKSGYFESAIVPSAYIDYDILKSIKNITQKVRQHQGESS